MEKRVIIAIAIAAIVLIGYPFYMKSLTPESPQGEVSAPGTTTESPTAPPVRAKGPVESITKTIGKLLGTTDESTTHARTQSASKTPGPDDESVVTINTPLYRAVISSYGAGVKSFELKEHKKSLEDDSALVDIVSNSGDELPLQTLVNISALPKVINFTPSVETVTLSGSDEREVRFYWTSPEGITIEKSYLFSAKNYSIKGSLKVVNGSNQQVDGSLDSILTAFYETEYPRFHSGPVTQSNNKATRLDLDDNTQTGQMAPGWLGLEDKFFLQALIPDINSPLSWKQGFVREGEARTSVTYPVALRPGTESTVDYKAYLGPKEYDVLLAENVSLETAIEFGFFAFMAKPVLVVLNFFDRYVKNYGLAIIILTIIIKILFHPLTKKSLESMKDMQKVQPQMKAIKERHKNDKTKQNKEIMDLYKKHKVNPLGGCLPMILQIPVFIALYEVLSVAIELRHSPFFLWIVDLSEKDPYYVTPLIMGATMFLQQKMTPTTMDPAQAKMMMFMPVIFTFLFLKFPAGLVLYWLVNNVITVAQHWQIHKAHA